ncbi:MAG: hypothetical protein JKY81_02485 [Colwellia sp.]|nr:hypothetical protein [Colwellia sp.]
MKKVKRLKHDHRGWFTQGKIYLVDEKGYIKDEETGRLRQPCMSKRGYWEEILEEPEEILSCPPPGVTQVNGVTTKIVTNPCAEIALPTNGQENIMSSSYPPQPVAPSMSPAMEMSSTPVKTVTYVYGQDITLMDDRSLMSSIVRAQVEISSLAAMEVESTKVQSMINDLEAAVSLMVEKLDEDCEG